MNLQHLCTAPHVSIYFDSWNNWLFMDWEGELTLEGVQHACLEVARCYLAHAYPRVLNSNIRVTGVDWEVAAWLASEFMPSLGLAGVEQLAWVLAPNLRGRNMAIETFNRLPHVAINLFDDLEQAVAWLQHTQPLPSSNCLRLPRPVSADTRLGRIVQAFGQQLIGDDALPELAAL